MTRFTQIKRLDCHGKPSRYYYVRTRASGRRSWKSTGADTLAVAKEIVRAWQVQAAQGETVDVEMLFGTALSQYESLKTSRVAASTSAYYKRFFNAWREQWGGRELRSISSVEIQAHMEAIRKEYAARTANLHLVILRGFFQWCVDSGFLSRSPAKRVSTWRTEKKSIRVIDAAEEARLLTSASMEGDRIHGYVLALVETGLRCGTVEGLQWTHVDFSKNEWRIPPELMKSRRPYEGRPISAPLLEWLSRNRKAAGPIFGPVHTDTWRRIVQRANLPGLTRHDLRRSFITKCRRAGLDLETTMWMSDHTDVKVVAACYRRVDASDAAKAMNGTA